ncbi:hypothetical protein Tco_1282365 [Tanacetum coccineum]
MTKTLYNWIKTNPLEPRKDPKSPSGISNFTGRVRGIPIFVGNFTYASDFMIVEDISSVIDPRMSPVVLGKSFVELSNMTYDLSSGVVKFINGIEEIAYKMPHKIDQYDSLSDMEKENTKSVYFRNEEDKRKGVEKYKWDLRAINFQEKNKILYITWRRRHDFPDGVTTLYLMRRSPGVLRSFLWTILG